jgi:NADPH:quinone reductase-like Zn-dependent oxidoreductase
VVDAVGSGVTNFAAGDRVYGIVVVMFGHPGAHAQFVNVSASRLRRIPEGLGFMEAAALPAAALTALNGLRLAGERASKRVLVNGGTGGVGHFAVQMARARGATVTAVCRGSHADRARALGAQTVLDYRTQDFTAGTERYDFILDTHPGVGFSRASRVLDRGGAYASTLPSPALMVHSVASSVLRVRRAYVANASDRPEDYAELEQRLTAGEYAPIIEHVFPLADAAKAFALAEAGGVVGKVMIEVT